MDYLIKLFAYRAAGVREYWIVNSDKKTVITYFFEGNGSVGQFSFDEAVPVNIYPGFEIRLADIISI